MGLETGNYVADLNIANPAAADAKSQGDDHLRLIKTALRNTFPGFTGAALVTGTNGGAANAYTLTPTTALVAYVAPLVAVFAPNAQNTGASTLNISGLGAKSIKTVDGAALTAADLVVGDYYAGFYDGTDFRLFGVTKRYVDGLAFGGSLPNQTGNASKFAQTDGSNVSWQYVFPSETGNSGKFLTNSGTVGSESWATIFATTAQILAGSSPTLAATPAGLVAAAAYFALTDAATVAWNTQSGFNSTLLLTTGVGASRAIGAPTNLQDGLTYTLDLVQPAAGGPLTVTWNAIWDFGQQGTPVLSTAANSVDKVVAQYRASTTKLYANFRRAA